MSNRVKTALRNRLSEENLRVMMKAAVEGPTFAQFNFDEARTCAR